MGISILNKDLPLKQITGVYTTDKLLPVYKKILSEDETVCACCEYIVNTAVSKVGEYIHPSGIIQEFIRGQLDSVPNGLTGIFKNLLSAAFYGFAVLEIVTDEEGNLIELPLVDPASLSITLSEKPENYGQIERFTQFFSQVYEAVLPPEKAVYFKYNVSSNVSTSPYGDSRLCPILSLCEIKKGLLEAWRATLERFGSPIAKYKIENAGALIPTPEGETISKIEYVKEQVSRVRNLSGWIVADNDDVDFIFPPDVGDSFESAINALNKLIMRGLMTPSLLLDNSEVGSYSLGSAQQELYLGFIKSLVQETGEVLINQLIKPLILYHFPGEDIFGEFTIIPNNADIQTQSALLIPLLNNGIIDLDNKKELAKIKGLLGL